MEKMWIPEVHWLELVARGVLVYIAVLIMLRVTGKRQVGQLAPFDLVLLLILSNAVQNAMTGGDNSFTGGILVAGVLVGMNTLVSNLTYRSKWLQAVIEGQPRVLIHNGKLYEEVMQAERLTRHELMSALRQAGCTGIEQVHVAMLENNGQISVIPCPTQKSHD